MGLFGDTLRNQTKSWTNILPHWSLSIRLDIVLFNLTSNDRVNIHIDNVKYSTLTMINN